MGFWDFLDFFGIFKSRSPWFRDFYLARNEKSQSRIPGIEIRDPEKIPSRRQHWFLTLKKLILKTLNVFCEVKIFEDRSWNFSLSFQIFRVFRNLWSKALFYSQLPIVKITCKFAKNKTSERRGKQYVQTRKMSIKRKKKSRHWSS